MKREGKPVKEVLHLVLSYKWYDVIESGEKPEAWYVTYHINKPQSR